MSSFLQHLKSSSVILIYHVHHIFIHFVFSFSSHIFILKKLPCLALAVPSLPLPLPKLPDTTSAVSIDGCGKLNVTISGVIANFCGYVLLSVSVCDMVYNRTCTPMTFRYMARVGLRRSELLTIASQSASTMWLYGCDLIVYK
jgi:hypothetical protein